MAQRGHMLPSKLHLACALAVLQTKPPELTVEDYILHLRENIRPSGRPHATGASGNHLDSASYWVQRFHQAEAARTKLEAKVTEYEREIERLNSELRSARSDSTIKTMTPTKRRKLPGVPTRAAKRRKVEDDDSGDSSVEAVDGTLSADMTSLSAVNEEGAKLAQHLYQAHKYYKAQSQGDHRLAYHLVQAADSLAPLLTSACQRHQQRIGRAASRSHDTNGAVPEPVLVFYNNELVSTFEAAARIFMSLFFGLKKLDSEKPTPEDRSAVIYSFVRMFSGILDTLKDISASQAAQDAAITQATNSRRQMTTRFSQKPFGRVKPQSLVTTLLSNFLSNVLGAPSAGQNQHEDLVEGFLFVLFRHLGDRIFRCTFGHQRCATVAEDIDAWIDPGPPTPGEGSPPPPPPPSLLSDREKQIEQRALEIELPLLASVLERGLSVAQRHMAPPGSSATATATTTSSSSSSRKQNGKAFTPKSAGWTKPSPSSLSAEALRAGLSLPARKKLERTLARAVFFGEDDGDDEMGECLAMPVRQALTAEVVRRGDDDGSGGGGDVKAWFVEKVWGLVGWQAVLEMR